MTSPALRSSDSPSERPQRPSRVLIAGNPNGGKTTVFNLLTGARAKVGNYPGITVTRRFGSARTTCGRVLQLVDLPGTYSLSARSREEQIAADAILGRTGPLPDAVVVVADATTLARGLYLALQVVETGLATVIVLNVMDEARSRGLTIDTFRLAERLGVPVVPMVAVRGEGREELLSALCRATRRQTPPREPVALAPTLALAAAEVERALALTEPFGGSGTAPAPALRRAQALWALLSVDEGDELEGIPAELRAAVERARRLAQAEGRELDKEIVTARYRRVDALLAEAVSESDAARTPPPSERLDRLLTHRVWGFAVFAAVMLVVFQTLFTWAEPAMGAIEESVSWLQNGLRGALPAGPLRGLLVDGVVAGVGNVLVFVPQIALLFLLIGLMEDSGYLSRVAFVSDRVMGRLGLHGKAFVPMLSGFACAVPAVLATRTIESRRDRLLTMMVVPLMSCSARLPVYVLITATVFDTTRRVAGVLSLGAVVLLGLYALSVATALLAAAVLRRTVLPGPRPPLVLELPPYRLPHWRNLLLNTWQPVRTFLVDAGTIILALTVVLWALLSYPRSPAVDARFQGLRAATTQTLSGEALETQLERLAAQEAGEQLRQSLLGRLGHALEPALEPIGQDWRIGVGILGAFAAREVFVSTLGIVFDIEEADARSLPLRQALRQASWPDGRRLLTPLSGVALLVFFVLACQCMSTLAVVRRESGSWRWPLLLFAYMSVLAYLAALVVYQGGRALGIGLAG